MFAVSRSRLATSSTSHSPLPSARPSRVRHVVSPSCTLSQPLTQSRTHRTVALFVIPVLVLLGWAIGQPMDLEFDTFETLLVFLAIIVVNFGASGDLTQSGRVLTRTASCLVSPSSPLRAPPLPQPSATAAVNGWKASAS